MKEANNSMITLGLYFEVHDSDLYGGKGSVGYATTSVDLKVSDLEKADISKYVDSQKQGVANMCKVEKEKIVIISRTDYEEASEDDDIEECIFY